MKMVRWINISITATQTTVITSLVAGLQLIAAHPVVAQPNSTNSFPLSSAAVSDCLSVQRPAQSALGDLVSSFTQKDDYEPPDNGGPERSGGSGTR